MEAARIRLLFDGGHILSKSQRRQGLKRSWLLLEPQSHTTISDLVSHLVSIFHLHDSCPNGLILSMNGFVLPPFESTTILKDNDLIHVKQRGDKVSKTINVIEEARTSDEEDLFKKPSLVPAMKLLANEEFEKETSGYQSDSQEDVDKEENVVLLVNSTSNMDPISRKRKSAKNFESSKKKRPHQIANRSVGNSVQDKHIECCQHDDGALKKRKPSMLNSKLVHEDGKETSTPSDIVDENKKSSRSSRRKKAKRLWLREIKKTEKEKLLERCLPMNVVAKKDSKTDQTSELQKVSLPMKDVSADSGSAEDLNDSLEHPEPDSEAEGEITPIVVRPGHIRFAPYGKDKDVEKNQDAKGAFQWNGITNKRQGQKWGIERQSVPQRYHPKNCNQDYSNRQIKGKRPATLQEDFEKLVPLIDSPKQDDVIAYRLLELSSSFCPELSSFRVGKILWFDPESNRTMLVPVPEYPVQFEKKTDESASGLPFETSQYKDDGSLEIDFHSLVNVRIVKRGNLNPSEVGPPTVVKQAPVANGQPSTSGVSNGGFDTPVRNRILPASGTQPIISKKEMFSRAPGKGDVDPWEELTQALDAKKTDLLQQDDKWNQNGNSEKRTWSYRTLQRSALGPTLNRLREQNRI
ncbi:hypothetical protein Dimus_026575 [Dionaea muscipula]